MKIIIAALMLMSSVSFASDLEAPGAFLSVVRAGDYYGDQCQVSIRKYSDSVTIEVSANGAWRRNVITSGNAFRYNPANRSFLFTNKTSSGNGSRESIVRTIAVTDRSQYIVVSELSVNNRDSSESSVECVFNF